MAAIRYTAHSRAPLITDSPAHTPGTQYEFNLKLQQYTQSIETPKQAHVSLGGQVETVLRTALRTYAVTFIWDDTDNAQVEEFLFSVAAGEPFDFSPYGSVGDSPDLAFSVHYMGGGFNIGRMTHGSTPWRSVSMILRPVGNA